MSELTSPTIYSHLTVAEPPQAKVGEAAATPAAGSPSKLGHSVAEAKNAELKGDKTRSHTYDYRWSNATDYLDMFSIMGRENFTSKSNPP